MKKKRSGDDQHEKSEVWKTGEESGAEDENPMALPDLLVVDGGKGQLSMAISVLVDLRLLDQVPVVGLAKKDVLKGELYDKIYIPNRSNPPQHLPIVEKRFNLLQQLRDEAHRFAITFQRKTPGKTGRDIRAGRHSRYW